MFYDEYDWYISIPAMNVSRMRMTLPSGSNIPKDAAKSALLKWKDALKVGKIYEVTVACNPPYSYGTSKSKWTFQFCVGEKKVTRKTLKEA